MRTRFVFTMLFWVFCGQRLYAQEGAPPEEPPPLDRISQALDADRNGELSAEEIENAPQILQTLDRNKDGQLTPDEIRPRFPVAPGGPGGERGGGIGPNRPEIKIAEKHDADGNGYLDPIERKAALEDLTTINASNPRRRGGPRGPAREPGRPGAKVMPEQVQNYPGHPLYDPSILRTIFIQFDTENWEEEMAAFKETDVEMPATVLVDGKKYDLVGLKFRGQSSFGHVPSGSKRSLNLSMDLVDSGQRLYGYKTLNLLNCNGDASMMSSALYAFIAQDFLPAPRANFVKVVINGESWGIFSNVQQFNKDFIKEHFRSTAGARWKVPGSPNADGGLRYLGEELDGYKERFEIKSKDKEESWRALVNLCKVLNETSSEDLPDEIESILDVDSLLRFLALDVVAVNSDGYWTRASDYSLYLDPTGMFHVIPHDMNEAFMTRGPRGRPGGERPGGAEPPPGPEGPRPGFDRGPPRNNDGERPGEPRGRPPEGRPEGRPGRRPGGRPGRRPGRRPGGGGGHGDASLDPLIGLDSDRMPLRSKILAVPAYRQKYLQYVKTIAEFKMAPKTIDPVIRQFRSLLLEEMKVDTRSGTSFDAFNSMTSAPSGEGPASGLYKFMKDRRDFLLAHDGIKGLASIENVSRKAEAPSVTTSGPKPSIAINEILASNENSDRDPQGEVEDWIELFNHGDTDVDLSGMYLSDDPENMFKWQIPAGTVLEAGSYLVIWADEDGDEAGLHANFKLSKKGESVTLVHRNVLVDKVEFGVQKSDVSSGLLGSLEGPWKELTPTPGAANRPLK